ncbi:S8 family serine peptidase [Enterococcus durans]|uniref:S8 family serine peptidase n=1 Tax=Enterococcus durans TaxID=53345 RepID=UPI00232CFC2B|nr:S8 family serine peptidase [Enterococcus durans]WCG26948.1 S8 family serine peptidase [Enterococcus durans]WCG68505.1 S8 family serine peptidase [Enterococcus durans]WKR35933.1 PrtP [Enterococcus durans]WKR35942.1 PrtP [Enterococcus durans]
MKKRNWRGKAYWIGTIGTTILLSPLFLSVYSSVADATEIPAETTNLVEDKQDLKDYISKKKAIDSELIKKAALAQLKAQGYYDENEKDVKATDKVRVMIRLKEKAAVEKSKKSIDTPESIEKVQEVSEKVIAKQETIQEKVEEIAKTKVIREFGLLINGFSMDVNYGDIEKLEGIEGVESVSVIKAYTPQDASANKMADIEKAWNDYNLKGENTVISIIDSGMDPSHQDLKLSKDTGVQLEKQEADQKIKNLGYGKYFSAKVPFGHNYADESEDVVDQSSVMHGQHVAGIAAANGVVKGVAPEAQLLAMKVFSNNDSQSCMSDDIIAAIEDSVVLGADVINMSLGSDAGNSDASDPEQLAIQAASDAGVLCVIAAGNAATSGTISGAATDILGTDDQSMISSPAVVSSALSVASAENTTATLPLFHVEGIQFNGYASYNGDLQPYMIAPTADYSDLKNKHELIDVGSASKEEISQLDAKNKIALIHGDTTNHSEKVANVKKAGAVAAVIYEDAQYAPNLTDISYPTICVFTREGTQLLSAMKQQKQFTFDFREEVIPNNQAGKMSTFSSWGPTPTLEFKPEITAPGGNIYSLANDNSYQSMNGTSMASPFVAGAEALIYQSAKNSQLNIPRKDLPQFAKNTLMNTAIPLIDHDHVNLIYSPRQQGAGLLNVGAALENTVSATDASDHDAAFALKEITEQTNFKVTLTNYGNDTKSYVFNDYGGVYTQDIEKTSLELYDSKINGASLTTANQKIEVPAKASIEVTVTLQLPATFDRQQFVEGYVGFSGDNTPDLVLPYMGYYGDYDAELITSPPYNQPGGKNIPTRAGFLVDVNSRNILGVKNSDVDPDSVAISPNGDGHYDSAFPYLYFYRNYAYAKYEIVDANDHVIQKVYEERNQRKDFFDQERGEWSAHGIANGEWDGKRYDTKTGKTNRVPDGQYRYKITTETASGQGEQVTYYPLKVDTLPPVIQGMRIFRGQGIALEFADKGSGVSDQVSLEINGQVLNRTIYPVSGQKNVYLVPNVDQFLINGQNFVSIEVADNALNTTIDPGKYYDGQTGQVINGAVGVLKLLNLTDNSVITSDSYSYDKVNKSYKIKGTYLPNTELFANGIKTVTGTTGAFSVAIPAVAQNTVVFSEDATGKNILGTYHFTFVDQAPTLEIEGVDASGKAIAHSENYHLKGKTNGVKVSVENQSAKKTVDLTSSLTSNGEFDGDIPLVFGENKLLVSSYNSNDEVTESTVVITTVDTTSYTGDLVEFEQLDGGAIIANKTSNYYNVQTKELQISGKLKYPVTDFRLNDEKINYDPDTLAFSYVMKNVDNGKHALKIYAQDNRLNDGRPVMNYSYPIVIDSTLPSLILPNLTVDSQGNYFAYTNQNPYAVRAEVNDNLAGYRLYINLNNAYSDGNHGVYNEKYYAGRQATTVDYPIDIEDGLNQVEFDLVDTLNNHVSTIVTVDYHHVMLATPVIQSNQTVANQVVTLHVDERTDAELYYSIDGNTWSKVKDDVTIAENKTVYYKYKDKYGNESAVAKYEVKAIRKEVASGPSIQLERGQNAIKVTLGYEKPLSKEEAAVHQLSYSMDKGKTWQKYTQPFEVTKDTELYVRTEDQAGNISDVVKEQLSLTENKVAETVVKTATKNTPENESKPQLEAVKTMAANQPLKVETSPIEKKQKNQERVSNLEAADLLTENLSGSPKKQLQLANKVGDQLLSKENKVFPTTNDRSEIALLIIGLLICASGVGIIFMRVKKRKN